MHVHELPPDVATLVKGIGHPGEEYKARLQISLATEMGGAIAQLSSNVKQATEVLVGALRDLSEETGGLRQDIQAAATASGNQTRALLNWTRGLVVANVVLAVATIVLVVVTAIK